MFKPSYLVKGFPGHPLHPPLTDATIGAYTAATVLGILAYAILRESYTWFYGRYGVVPEDVGISQIRMLTGVLRIFHLWCFRYRAVRRRAS